MSTVTQPTITEFILARITEDEDLARVAANPPGYYQRDDTCWLAMEEYCPAAPDQTEAWTVRSWQTRTIPTCPHDFEPDHDCGGFGMLPQGFATHIAQHDPARVLAQCEAMRRIAERHESCDDTSFEDPCSNSRDLAAIWSDHPDYDDTWRAL